MDFNATLIGEMISFAILIWFCVHFIWPHINKAIESFSLGTSVDGIAAVITVHAGTYSDENISCSGYSAAICVSRGGSSANAR